MAIEEKIEGRQVVFDVTNTGLFETMFVRRVQAMVRAEEGTEERRSWDHDSRARRAIP
jgi:hypothetical protein